MNPLDLKPTNTTPEISFSKNKLTIAGRSIPLSDVRFYDPFIEWAKTLESAKLSVDIKLEYMNSSSSKKLLQLLKTLDVNSKILHYTINWYYEDGDEESKEQGKVFEKLLKKAGFRYVSFKDIK
jgi:hypothetical protein